MTDVDRPLWALRPLAVGARNHGDVRPALLVRLGDDATLLTLASLERELSDLLDVDVEVVTDGALSSGRAAFVESVLGEAVPL